MFYLTFGHMWRSQHSLSNGMWLLRLINSKVFTPNASVKLFHETKTTKIVMDNAYVRHFDGEEHFEMILKYTNPSLKIDRKFNFRRQLSETVETFLNRVSTNIEKILSKKTKKKKEAETTNSYNIDINLIVDGQSIDKTLTCEDVFRDHKNKDIHIKIDDSLTKVIINAPWVEKITLSSQILAGFPTYPNRFESVFTNKALSEFRWYQNDNTNTWSQVGTGFIFTPPVETIGKNLKLSCLPKNEEMTGPGLEIESTSTVQAGPKHCPFETRHEYTKNRLSEKSFRMVTYNILADLYCDSDYSRDVLYFYCPPYALSIDYRKQLIIKEIIGYNADIICLQEVDEKVYDLDLNPVLSDYGFSSIFNKKGNVAEGLSCFFRSDRFKKIESGAIVLGKEVNTNPIFEKVWKTIESNTALCERVVARETTLQHVVLESLDNPNEILLVGNIHLYFHPDADHIRLLQAGLGILYLDQVYKELSKKFSHKRISLIFSGDFNSVPSCGIFQLMTSKSVPEDHLDWSSNQNEAIKDLSFQHSFDMASACGTPYFTNYTHGFSDCLDYIFIQHNHLDIQHVVPFPPLEELKANIALPSIVFPSDHIALIADLEWK